MVPFSNQAECCAKAQLGQALASDAEEESSESGAEAD